MYGKMKSIGKAAALGAAVGGAMKGMKTPSKADQLRAIAKKIKK
jgi:hypothetical protein